MSKNKQLFLALNYIVCIIAVFHITMVSIQFNFDFSPQGRMTHPGMAIAFLTACTLNITRLNESKASLRINKVSFFANLLTLSLAIAFTVQNPVLPKLITTSLMLLITLESVFVLFKYKLKNKQVVQV